MLRPSLIGPFWMVVSCFSFATMGVFVKLGSTQQLSTAELMFYRALIALLVIVLVIVLPNRHSLRISGPICRLYASRSLSGSVSMMMATYAMVHLPLPTAITLQNTAPFFLMAIVAVLHRTVPRPAQALAIALGFAGIVWLLQPTFSSDSWLAGSLGLCSGLLTAASVFSISELGQRGEPEWRVAFYFLLACTVLAAIWMLLQPMPLQLPAPEAIGSILGMGIAAGIAQITVTRAYSQGKSLAVASLSYLTVAFTSLYGVLLWDDRLPLASYAAMGLIVVAGILSALRAGRT